MSEEERAKQVWMCTFCGAPYDAKEQAEQCWESHTEMTIDYVWPGVGGGEMPLECIVKKHERGFVTKIAVYKREEVKEVHIRERKKIEQ